MQRRTWQPCPGARMALRACFSIIDFELAACKTLEASKNSAGKSAHLAGLVLQLYTQQRSEQCQRTTAQRCLPLSQRRRKRQPSAAPLAQK